jgi:Tfp pilus assembly protein PilN
MDSFENLGLNDLDDLDDLEDIEASPATTVSPRQLLLLWLIAGSLLLALVPFGLLSRSLQDDILAAEAEIEQIQNQLAEEPTPPPDVQPLLATLEAVQQQITQIEEAADSISGAHVYWPAVMDAVRQYDSLQLTLTALNQEERQIILKGEAVNDAAVVDYTQSLEASGLFSRVLIQSINLLNREALTATATLAATITPLPPTTVTVTATPGLRDTYEVDDFDPNPIFFDQPQLHNFYPVYDIDKVTFLAKAQRYYRVYTTDLRPGVDTVLEVRVGGATYQDDDRAAGDLSSEVVFQAGSYDTDAVVKITNRGEYGPEKQYRVVVEEVLPTPTPTFAPESPTPTPSPTATDTPVPQQSPTPDLRDPFEPDELPAPPPIALGETQRHNFYPAGDVDYLAFLAKAGRIYRISTSNLALGVDTVLTVTVGTEVQVHDDRSVGDLGSEIIMTIPDDRDYQALITVANRGQYGSDAYYQISLKEVAPTPTPSPTPTPEAETESSLRLSRSPGMSRAVSRWHLLPVGQTFLNPEAVSFVIILELEAMAP